MTAQQYPHPSPSPSPSPSPDLLAAPGILMLAATDPTVGRSTVVDRFLVAVCSGDFAHATGLYTESSVLDAVVPQWRLGCRGEAEIVAEYARWFADPGELEDVVRHATSEGEVVEYTLTWDEDGTPHAGRHVHVLRVDRELDRIVADHVWCGGRWPAALLAEMGAAAGPVGP
jgi:hypothetical protein